VVGDNLQHPAFHALPVFLDQDLLAPFADGDRAAGLDEIGQVDLEERAGTVAAVVAWRSV
jgi:hypothetical protein